MNKIAVVLLACLLFTGCSTYQSPEYTTAVFKNISSQCGDLFIELGPIVDKEHSVWYLNFPPAKYDILPVYIKVLNNGDIVKQVDMNASYLTDNKSEDKYESLSVEEAVKATQGAGWMPAVAFGVIGSVVAGDAEKRKDDDYHLKSFKPSIINAGSGGEGVVFFKVPKDKILNNEFVLNLVVEDLQENKTEEIKITFLTGGH